MAIEIRSCGNCKWGKRQTKASLPQCTKDVDVVTQWKVDEVNGIYICGEWKEKVFTHADAIRKMTDEQLHAEILRLQDIAAACPECHRKTGAERLRMYLSTRCRDDS